MKHPVYPDYYQSLQLGKYRGVDGLRRSIEAGRSYIDRRGQIHKMPDEYRARRKELLAKNDEWLENQKSKTEHIGTPLEDIRYKQSTTRLPYSDKDVRKELGTYGTMLNSADQEKFRKDLHQQRNEELRLQERNGGQSVRETETGTETVPGRTIIRSGGNAKDLRSDILAERRSAGHAEPHVKKITGLKKDDRRTDRRK